MKVVDTVADLRAQRALWSESVGFVPTMGALHPGHQSLIRTAKERCSRVVVSIFVNQTQFGPGEDFQKYPRDRENDLELCAQAGADLVWFPLPNEIYPSGCQSFVEVETLGHCFEGASRPGHFRGVATVVTKLFNAVMPDQAYFGEKDLQQLVLVRRLAIDLLMPIQIVAVPTYRDAQGLALSSRNEYLTSEQRQQASRIFRALTQVQDLYGSGERQVGRLKAVFIDEIAKLDSAEIERLDLLDSELSREFLEGESIHSGFCSVAVRYSGVRLIDNIELCC